MVGSKPSGRKGQIALEFMIVYSFIIMVFIVLFALVVSQRGTTLNIQEQASLQLVAQNIATAITTAATAGNGYSGSVPIAGSISGIPYNLTISTSGVVVTSMKIGRQIVTEHAFSGIGNLTISGTPVLSANGITLYLVPVYTGSITVANSKGQVFVNQPAASALPLPESLAVTQTGSVKGAVFSSAQNSMITAQTANVPIATGGESITGWFYLNAFPPGSSSVFPLFSQTGGGGIGVLVATTQSTPPHELVLNITAVGSNTKAYIPTNVIAKNWYMFLVTYVPSSTTTFCIYSNPTPTCTNMLAISGPSTVNAIQIGSMIYSGSQQSFNGTILNIQMYNSTLTSNQANQIYAQGIGAQPLPNSGLVGWWPLNGNANDYSGKGSNGYSANVVYQSLYQLQAHVAAGTGSNAYGALVGVVAGRGQIGQTGRSSAQYAGQTGNQSFIIASNYSLGITNATINVFNGNLSTVGNVVGWWPLDEGYGSNTFDLSTLYHNGYFRNASWSVANNQTNFAAAALPGDPTGQTFNAIYDGYITVNNTDSLNNIPRNGSFTAVAWVYYTGAPSTFHCQGVIGDEGGFSPLGAGFQLVGYGGSANNCQALYVNNTSVPWPSGMSSNSFPANRWEMVTAQYNGNTGLANIYLNNAIYSTNSLPAGLSVVQKRQIYIGSDAWTGSGLDGFNGMITNVQLYSGFLSPQQINQIYQGGIGAPPVSNAGLVGWWQLNGNANDSSVLKNFGVAKYNVVYTNSQYIVNATGSRQLAFFNGTTSKSSVYAGNVPQIGPSTNWTVSFWMYPTNTMKFRNVLDMNFVPSGNNAGPRFEEFGSALNLTVGTSQATFNIFTYSNSIKPNTWYHVVAVRQAGSAVGYLNGAQVFNRSNSLWPSYFSNVTIGRGGQNALTNWFSGYITNVQVYSNSLTATQVYQLYQQGLPLYQRLNVSQG
ncbi:MAG: hypothetical protein KGH98_02140 [Candidatus Micrarchaeota archaeon]|nr:hypothetical protein [Candidatus Micrarchaeota archaeon]